MHSEFHFGKLREQILLHEQKPTELGLRAETHHGVVKVIHILKPGKSSSNLGSTTHWLGASQNLNVFSSKTDIIIPSLRYSY